MTPHTTVTEKLTASQLTMKFHLLWILEVPYYSEEPVMAFYVMPDESTSHLIRLSDAF
jgi:hypothetical protein